MIGGGLLLAAVALISLVAPLLSGVDPLEINPTGRFARPGAGQAFGGDALGRDLWSRTLHGGRVSLLVGIVVAAASAAGGLILGLVTGYARRLDGPIMRVMDCVMAVPGVLLAIALMTLTRPSITNVIVAIAIPEIPRVVRLVRSTVLSIRELPYVEAAVAMGARTLTILVRHILPNTIAPLTVQASYVCASAIITEAYLSFLGAGTPPEVPSWGNIMAEGRVYFQIAPWIILIPGTFVAAAVLSINSLGDGLRDMLDPRMVKGFSQTKPTS
jgi:peptide/nickel transport system permease protein